MIHEGLNHKGNDQIQMNKESDNIDCVFLVWNYKILSNGKCGIYHCMNQSQNELFENPQNELRRNRFLTKSKIRKDLQCRK